MYVVVNSIKLTSVLVTMHNISNVEVKLWPKKKKNSHQPYDLWNKKLGHTHIYPNGTS